MKLNSTKLQLDQYKYLALFLLAAMALLLTLHGMVYSADTLFPFRYANLIHLNEPYALLVQPAPRFFPDVLYAFISLIITDNTLDQTKIVSLLNITILGISVVYFFSVIFKDVKLKYIFASFFCILLPILYLFKFGSLRLNLFAPGIHGFAIPYQLFMIGLSLKFIKEKELSKWGWLTYFFIGTLCGVNDSLFIPSTIVPICFSFFIIWIINKNEFQNKNFFKFVICNFAIVFITLLSNKILNYLFDHIHFLSTSNHYFQTDFLTWYNGSFKSFLNQFFNIRITQGTSYLVFLSVLISITSVIRNINKSSNEISTNLLFLNIINISWLPIALLSMWAIDKGLVRYIPYILLISPVILIVNFHKFILKHSNKIFYSILIIIFIFGFHFIKEHQKYKYRTLNSPSNYQGLMLKLSELKEQGVITANGLSNYWISWSSTSEYGFKISSINNHGIPYVYVSDALAYWDKKDGSLEKIKHSFVVNRYKKASKSWLLDETKLLENYGKHDESIPFTDNYERKYLIYVYKNGINSDLLYEGANRVKDQYFKKSE